MSNKINKEIGNNTSQLLVILHWILIISLGEIDARVTTHQVMVESCPPGMIASIHLLNQWYQVFDHVVIFLFGDPPPLLS